MKKNYILGWLIVVLTAVSLSACSFPWSQKSASPVIQKTDGIGSGEIVTQDIQADLPLATPDPSESSVNIDKQ